MRQQPCQERVLELIDTDPPGDVLERLAGVDALLRTLADRFPPRDRCEATRTGANGRAATLGRDASVRRRLRLVWPPPNDTWRQSEEHKQVVKLSVAELGLIYRSLEAARTLRVVPPQDELLEDTMQLIDQALRNA